MATLSRFSTSLARLSDHLLRPPRTPLKSRCNPGPGHFDLITNHGRTGPDGAAPGPSSSSGSGRPQKNGSRSVGFLSREEAPSDPPLPHALVANFEAASPLCERPGTSIASLLDVCRWRIQARELAASVGSEFVDADGGPEVSELLRELEWLLDDAVAACCASGSDNLSCQSSVWKPCAWQDVKALQIAELESGSSLVASGAEEDGAADVSVRDGRSVPLLNSITEKVPKNGHGLRKKSKRELLILLRMSVGELDKAWKERIQKRRPFQYVVAAAHWREYVLGVTEGVLIPRPETEQMVDLVESAISADKSLGEGMWADLGTGSGAIAIAVASLLGPSGSVMAVDASSAAVLVATRNIERYSLQNKVKVRQGFWFSPLQDKLGELAGVVSNPPYIPSDRLTGLQAEVGKHEPRIALDGGPDGVHDLREICRGSATALRQGGFLVLETNGGEQTEFLCDLLSEMRVLASNGIALNCFQEVKSVKDFAGITRFVTAIHC